MMTLFLIIFLIIAFFEIRRLFQSGKKKEATIYIIIMVLTVLIALYLIFSFDYESFARIILHFLGIENQGGTQ